MGWPTERLAQKEEDTCRFLFCQICFEIVEDPVECKKCQNHYCRKCINEWKKKSNSCPVRCPGAIYEDAHILMRFILGETKFKCENYEFGCPVQVAHKHISSHHKECKYKPVMCPHIKCSKKVAKASLQQHLSECIGFEWECPNKCGFQTTSRDDKEEHNCDEYIDKEIQQAEEKKNNYLKFGKSIFQLGGAGQNFIALSANLMRAKMKKQMLQCAKELKEKTRQAFGLA